MAKLLLSEAERIFTLHCVQDGLRCDGRGNEDFRYMEIETDVLTNTSGSAHLRLENTDILVGVKAELGEPEVDKPDEGRLQFFVDCSANATPKFEGRGGEELALQISQTLSRAYNSQLCLDMKALSIIPGQQCWVLYVDILILECGGNLFDAASMAVKAALYNTKIPRINVQTGEKGDNELEISDDPYNCQTVEVSKAPVIVTLNKIGHHHVVDATMSEEACSLARLTFGVTEDGALTSLRKVGSGSLDPDSIIEMMQSSKRVGQNLNKVLMQRLKEEEELGDRRKHVGFLR